jgi:uncharacterized membrane protein YtjA (UPF0391 family)
MKYSVLLLALLSFLAAIFGFGLLSGVPAIVCRILFVTSFTLAGVILFRASRVRKPVPSSFAASFKTEPSEPPAP